ncbi:hypothetical protein ABIQ69_12335 [Agromyces sp. G08B096]|uniref:Lipoprotein n=1 Tax=Agromyces sp. G08B096 TaxID=3156399 RepID=A0AAU7W6Q2_9MICO
MSTRSAAPMLALAAIAGLLLTGCAAGTDSTADTKPAATAEESTAAEAPAEQSIAEACTELQTTLNESATALQDGMSTFSQDPAAAVAALTSFADEFEAVRAELGNAEVKAQAEAAGAKLDEMIVALEAGVADPAAFDATAFLTTAQGVQTELVAIGELCTQ